MRSEGLPCHLTLLVFPISEREMSGLVCRFSALVELELRCCDLNQHANIQLTQCFHVTWYSSVFPNILCEPSPHNYSLQGSTSPVQVPASLSYYCHHQKSSGLSFLTLIELFYLSDRWQAIQEAFPLLWNVLLQDPLWENLCATAVYCSFKVDQD